MFSSNVLIHPEKAGWGRGGGGGEAQAYKTQPEGEFPLPKFSFVQHRDSEADPRDRAGARRARPGMPSAMP